MQEDPKVKQSQRSSDAPRLPNKPWSFIWYFITQYRWALGLMLLLEIGQKATQILVPYAFKEILDGALAYKGEAPQIMEYLKSDIWFFVLVSVGTVIFARSSGALLVLVGPSLRQLVRLSLYHFLQHHSHRYFISHFAGSLANRINEISMSVNHGLWTVMFDFMPITISFGVSIYLLYNAHVGLALFLAGWIAIYIVVSFFLARKAQRYAKNFAAARSKTTGHIVDAVTNVMNTKLFAALPYERSRLDSQLVKEKNQARTTFWFMEKMRWFQFGSALLLQVGLILLALRYFSQGSLTVGNFAMAASLGLLLINDARGLSRRFLEFFEYLGNITDGVGIIVNSHEIVDPEGAEDLQVSKGEIRFKDVNFSYGGNASVFEKLNVTIQPGEKVGLVGFSGSGKTTFANLILRLFEPNSGKILIDEQDIADCTQDSLRAQISMIPQDPMLFHRSLRENIRYGKLDASDQVIEEAAEKANAHEFIQKIPEKYEALVGERGVKLSGGQRQRVAIARAIVKNAPVLLLDEATSSLDSVTEKSIQTALENVMQDKTVIVIAHRLSTISHMDRILVFKDGKIIEDGSHEELLSKNGHYGLLWKMQAGGFLPAHEEDAKDQDPSWMNH